MSFVICGVEFGSTRRIIRHFENTAVAASWVRDQPRNDRFKLVDIVVYEPNDPIPVFTK